MTGTGPVQRVGQRLIRTACRRLPADVRADRCREWTAELTAILADESPRSSWLGVLRALAFCAGIFAATRRLSRSELAGARRARKSQWRSGAPLARPGNLTVRLVTGLVAWVVISAGIIAVLITRPDPRGLPFLLLVALAVGFDSYCLADVVRAREVRYLPKWAWALVCIAQIPAGGIAYLCVGRVGQARSASSERN